MPFMYSIISIAVFFLVSFHLRVLSELKQRKTMLDQFIDEPKQDDLLGFRLNGGMTEDH